MVRLFFFIKVKIIIIIFFRACPLATLGGGLRFQVRGRPWDAKRQKELRKSLFAAASPAASALAGFPPAPSRSQLACTEPFKLKIESEKLRNENCLIMSIVFHFLFTFAISILKDYGNVTLLIPPRPKHLA